MSVSAKVEVKSYIGEVVDELLLSGVDVIPAGSTDPVKIAEGSIPADKEGIAVGVAVTRNGNSVFFLKINEKQRIENGLNTAALGGLDEETLVLEDIPAGKKWEIGLTNVGGADITQYWRFRIRIFKKA